MRRRRPLSITATDPPDIFHDILGPARMIGCAGPVPSLNRRAFAMNASFKSALMIAALALPVAAMAQTTPPTTAPAATEAPAMAAPATHAATRHRPPSADRVEERITQLHSELKITPAEETEWNSFADVMRSNATAVNQAYTDRSTKISSMNAADNMSSYAALSMQHAQDLQKLATAFQTLYAALSPDQQKIADQTFRGPGPHHH
jgi:periplasmic protein CpxP/Spy